MVIQLVGSPQQNQVVDTRYDHDDDDDATMMMMMILITRHDSLIDSEPEPGKYKWTVCPHMCMNSESALEAYLALPRGRRIATTATAYHSHCHLV